jgi:hypothetical protein
MVRHGDLIVRAADPAHAARLIDQAHRMRGQALGRLLSAAVALPSRLFARATPPRRPVQRLSPGGLSG